MTPGARPVKPLMALNRWVVPTTPPAARTASATARAVASSATVCPKLTRTPARASATAASPAPGSSGASVATRTTPKATTLATRPGVGSTANGGWAPKRCGLTNGPSRWAPRTAARGTSPVASGVAAATASSCMTSATPRRPASTAGHGAVSVVGNSAVVPWRRCAAASARTPSGPVHRVAATTAVDVHVHEARDQPTLVVGRSERDAGDAPALHLDGPGRHPVGEQQPPTQTGRGRVVHDDHGFTTIWPPCTNATSGVLRDSSGFGSPCANTPPMRSWGARIRSA